MLIFHWFWRANVSIPLVLGRKCCYFIGFATPKLLNHGFLELCRGKLSSFIGFGAEMLIFHWFGDANVYISLV